MFNDIDRIYIMEERYQCLMIEYILIQYDRIYIMKERYQCLIILIQYI